MVTPGSSATSCRGPALSRPAGQPLDPARSDPLRGRPPPGGERRAGEHETATGLTRGRWRSALFGSVHSRARGSGGRSEPRTRKAQRP